MQPAMTPMGPFPAQFAQYGMPPQVASYTPYAMPGQPTAMAQYALPGQAAYPQYPMQAVYPQYAMQGQQLAAYPQYHMQVPQTAIMPAVGADYSMYAMQAAYAAQYAMPPQVPGYPGYGLPAIGYPPAAAPAAPIPPVGQSAAAVPVHRQFDADTEAQLERWVDAKRQKDFSLADEIRSALRSKGVDPDTVRPSGRTLQEQSLYASLRAGGGTMLLTPAAALPGAKFDAETEAKLDRWVAAKREKDFGTADTIRSELRTLGVEPDNERPSDKEMQLRHATIGQAPGVATPAMGIVPQAHPGAAAAPVVPFGMAPPLYGCMGVCPTMVPVPVVAQPTQPRYDSAVEAKLDRWVSAKREKDFALADAIRSELRLMGVEPDNVRPSDKDVLCRGGAVGGVAAAVGLTSKYPLSPAHSVRSYDPETEAKLDRWVAAKREKDFTLADTLRSELRAAGVEPDNVRPSDRDVQIMRLNMGEGAAVVGVAPVIPPVMTPPTGAPPPLLPVPGGSRSSSSGLQREIDRQLDRWVEAKRTKDFETADAIRTQLRLKGIEPDEVRPFHAAGGDDEEHAAKRARVCNESPYLSADADSCSGAGDASKVGRGWLG
eukprot:TRINITY_DN6790_c0_g1_i1.p1 TRINITY_DN6790_c0_g1~~TRINITY_DN6790_c0_g1_i1.p1  ORF type:complete len:602 (-),score=111.01 TRINITY_DN6790_c0_g1_i1:251-2056(-)